MSERFEELVSTAEAARLLGVHRGRVHYALERGWVNLAGRVAGRRLLHRDDLGRLAAEIERHARKPKGDRG